MYEYHGWATLRETYLNEDNFDEKIDEIVSVIKSRIDEIGIDNGLLDLRTVNGAYQLHLSGLLNHKGKRVYEIFDLYDLIAKTAVGSYGILYVFDDEDDNGHENEFQCYVLAKGKFTKRIDSFLSPYTPTVEE
ncbi:hypothetical protein AGMMS49975_29510 [Clostridia bacterium]|nr:hypothetical protein AGMMS49975_29510 [Clostridia bacterium]GHU74122.1 hypothetical protein FACS1894188_01430 [Clostridia bacterium]